MGAPACSNSRDVQVERNREMQLGAGSAGSGDRKRRSLPNRSRRRPWFAAGLKNGLRGSPRSPPSSAPGLWTNPSATQTSPPSGHESVRLAANRRHQLRTSGNSTRPRSIEYDAQSVQVEADRRGSPRSTMARSEKLHGRISP